jgi:uncharacterized integral membrane protein
MPGLPDSQVCFSNPDGLDAKLMVSFVWTHLSFSLSLPLFVNYSKTTRNLTQSDVDGVSLYRSSLAICAALTAIGVGTSLAGLPIAPRAYDALYFSAAASFGVSLQTIHIYLKPMHNLVKGLWATGVLCSSVLAISPLLSTGALVSELQLRPELMLAVGWQFVALTGLFFKEAFCFGRAEAAALTLLVPLLSAGHFLRLLPGPVENAGALAFAVLFLFFAARKFQQPARDDLGDKSVFDHLERGGSL